MSTTTTPKPVGLNPSATPIRPHNHRRTAIIAGIALAAVVLIAVVLNAVGREEAEPPLNADTITMVKFINSPAYQKLPFARQALFMKVLEDRDDNDELDDAFDAGRITEDDYRAADLEAWAGQQLKRTEKFHGYANEQARLKYVRELLDKKEEKDQRKAQKAAGGGSKEQKPSDLVQRDETMEEVRIASWPADMRAKWQAFRNVYKQEKDARERAAATGNAISTN
jgi:hypothetical protein